MQPLLLNHSFTLAIWRVSIDKLLAFKEKSMGNSYWKYVEPIWDTVSIYDGSEAFLSEFNKATDKQKILYSSHWAQSEIMNGGLGQFFSNPTGVLAPEAVAAFKEIGMPNCAETLTKAMKFFGENYPRERSIREEAFEEFYEKYGEDSVPLEELEDIMATEIEDENGGFEDAANKYAGQG